jgi:hypothetical protein
VSPSNITHHFAAMWMRQKNEEPSSISSQEFRVKFTNTPPPNFIAFVTLNFVLTKNLKIDYGFLEFFLSNF